MRKKKHRSVNSGSAGFSALIRQLQFALALISIVPIFAISYLILRYVSPEVLSGEGVAVLLAVLILMLTGTRMVFRLIARALRTAGESGLEDFDARLKEIRDRLSKEGRSIRHTVAEATALIGAIPLLAVGYVVVRYVLPVETTENILILTTFVAVILFLGICRIYHLTNRIITVAAGAKLVHMETSMPKQDYGVDEIGDLSMDLYRIAGKLSKRAAELKQTRTFLSHLFERLPQPLLVVSSSGVINLTNPAALRLMGYREEELVGLHISSIFADKEIAGRLLAFQGKTCRETVWQKKDGTLIPVEVCSGALSSEENESALVMIGTDLTERRQLEEELQHAQKMEAIGLLAGGIAHDFNNILTVLHGHSYFLGEGLDDDDPLQVEVGNLEKTLRRASSLTYQLLTFSKKQVLNPRIINLNTVIKSMNNLLRRLLGENIEISTFLASGLGNTKADEGQMEQIIVNMAINSRDAMPGGGRLIVESANISRDEAYARRHPDVAIGQYAMVSITDTGCGMNGQVKRRIFEPFFTAKKSMGSGLGLSTAYGIVRQHGGHILVHSTPGTGTTLKIYLPCVTEEVEPAAAGVKSSPAPRGSETILLVEDDNVVLEVGRRALATHGYTVMTAENGREALDIAGRHDGCIDLLVTDVVMPEMTDSYLIKSAKMKDDLNLLAKPYVVKDFLVKVRETLDKI